MFCLQKGEARQTLAHGGSRFLIALDRDEWVRHVEPPCQQGTPTLRGHASPAAAQTGKTPSRADQPFAWRHARRPTSLPSRHASHML
jgi:hypothetical protein